jgi:hypothetical protein
MTRRDWAAAWGIPSYVVFNEQVVSWKFTSAFFSLQDAWQ